MAEEKKERWMELCEQAAGETDSAKLSLLVEEIDRLLREKHNRSTRDISKSPPHAA